jgi:biotin synthase-related radical SAM superfamily protein
VPWPLYPFDEIVDAVNHAPAYVQRTCISMITNPKCRSHTAEMARRLSRETPLPVSVLISPTIMEENDLVRLKDAGVDKIGVALDLATAELFEAYRGRAVSGPHAWGKYWQMIEAGLRVFGRPNVGAHLMVGMGETEAEVVSLIQRLWDKSVLSHLFSFFAEEASALAGMAQPPWPVYLRVQLARYLIEEGLSRSERMTFDPQGRLFDFGVALERLAEIISTGLPFMTTGCLGPDGRVACNRPFGNCLPDVRQWNYAYPPNEEELHLIRRSLDPSSQKGFDNRSES